MSSVPARPARDEVLKPALERLYRAFDVPDSAADPIHIVRRYGRLEDREVVAFIASALAFGRVASVLASVEAVCRVLGPSPAAFVRQFDPARDGGPLRALVHRWTRGEDLVALLWILRSLLESHGSLERAFAVGHDPASPDVGPALEAFAARARAVDCRPAYGRRPRQPGVFYFFTRPSTGSACKRVNLFLRWMVRRDSIDPGGWTAGAGAPAHRAARHAHDPHRPVPAPHPPPVARLEDGRGDHGRAASSRPR